MHRWRKSGRPRPIRPSAAVVPAHLRRPARGWDLPVRGQCGRPDTRVRASAPRPPRMALRRHAAERGHGNRISVGWRHDRRARARRVGRRAVGRRAVRPRRRCGLGSGPRGARGASDRAGPGRNWWMEAPDAKDFTKRSVQEWTSTLKRADIVDAGEVNTAADATLRHSRGHARRRRLRPLHPRAAILARLVAGGGDALADSRHPSRRSSSWWPTACATARSRGACGRARRRSRSRSATSSTSSASSDPVPAPRPPRDRGADLLHLPPGTAAGGVRLPPSWRARPPVKGRPVSLERRRHYALGRMPREVTTCPERAAGASTAARRSAPRARSESTGS